MPTAPFNLAAVQAHMRSAGIDAWIIYDFRASNPVLRLLVPSIGLSSRRALLFIPSSGTPTVLHSGLDLAPFKQAPFPREQFLDWAQWRAWLAKRLAGARRVAMEYSPGGMLPVVSIVDAGAMDLIRSLGVEVVSSADLIQVSLAVWNPKALRNHDKASALVTKVKDSAFALITRSHREGTPIDEYAVQQHIMERFAASGLETYHPPIVGVNAHSGDPHYEPSATNSTPIKKGDWVLIDLWARIPGDHNIHSDITWVGYCGKVVPAKHKEVFAAVRGARDASLALATTAWKKKQRLEGWQLDDAARSVIIKSGYGKAIKHRTGHSLSPGKTAHGIGVNLDNMETHDTRQVLPGVGYTIEPGIYLREFGVRLEINVYTDPLKGPRVTSCIQDKVLTLA
jgi:Xaa-Pro dipeptidase